MGSTSRKLALAFSLVVLAFGIASVADLISLRDMHRLLHNVEHQEESVHAAFALSNAVRDQYAHQAHILILGNLSHLRYYEEAHARALEALERVVPPGSSGADRLLATRLRASCGELDVLFRQKVVPAVEAHDAEEMQAAHTEAMARVAAIQADADTLVSRYEASIEGFGGHAEALQHGSVRWTLLLLLGATLFAASMGIIMGRSIARPVAQLELATARVAKGDLDSRVRIEGSGEIAQLARRFDSMTLALKEHQERLIQSEKLAGIGRLAAGIAHEINNPLGVILGFVRILHRRADGELAADLGIIEQEAVRCRDIVEGLLDLARPVSPGSEPVDFLAMTREIVERLDVSGTLGNVRIEVSAPDGGLAAGQPQQLRQVVLNLLRNAVEASNAGGLVTVDIRQVEQGELDFVVRDRGAGLPIDAEREKLFEPFFTTKPHGRGLGLAVSQAIARAHGGLIEARNAPGGGAIFRLTLPRGTG